MTPPAISVVRFEVVSQPLETGIAQHSTHTRTLHVNRETTELEHCS